METINSVVSLLDQPGDLMQSQDWLCQRRGVYGVITSMLTRETDVISD